MPMYDYLCVECGHHDTEFFKMSSASVQPCPACAAPQGYHKQVSAIHTDLQEFHTPIEMFSIAMEDLQEIRNFKQRCPDVDCSDDPNHRDYGIPIARNRKAKLQAYGAAGFVETN